MWVDNEDGTYTAEKDDTLWGLAQEIFGDGSRWEEFCYEGDPTKLQVGDTVGRKAEKLDVLDDISNNDFHIPQPTSNDSAGYSRLTNTMIGIVEVTILGVGMWYLAYKNGQAVVLTGGAASVHAGKAALETFSAGSLFMALGIARITGANNTKISDEIVTVFTPLAAAILPGMERKEE